MLPTLANSQVSGLMSERGITLYIRSFSYLGHGSHTQQTHATLLRIHRMDDTFVIAGTTVSGAAVPMSMGLMEATKCLYLALSIHPIDWEWIDTVHA